MYFLLSLLHNTFLTTHGEYRRSESDRLIYWSMYALLDLPPYPNSKCVPSPNILLKKSLFLLRKWTLPPKQSDITSVNGTSDTRSSSNLKHVVFVRFSLNRAYEMVTLQVNVVEIIDNNKL